MTTMTDGNSSHKQRSKAMHACKSMKSLLALWVGHDLDEAEEKEVRRHVADCEPCREFSVELRGSQEVLEKTVSTTLPVAADSPSIWPELRATLLHRSRRTAASSSTTAWSSGFWRVQNWFPVGAISAACLTIWFASSSNSGLPSEWPSEVRAVRSVPSQSTADLTPFLERKVHPAMQSFSDAASNAPRDLSRLRYLAPSRPFLDGPDEAN